MNIETAKAGALLCIDGGSYSDYQVTGFFVVLRDFTPAIELETYLETNPEERKDYHFTPNAFLAALLAKGLLLEVEYGTLYLSGYCCVSDVRFTPVKQ